MRIRIAVFLDSIDFKDIDNGIKVVLLFDVSHCTVTAAGRQLLVTYNINYLITWLMGKNVKEVYIDHPDVTIKDRIEYAGIRVYPLDKIVENPLLKCMNLPPG